MATPSSGPLNDQPDNTQFLSPLGFNFSIKKLPNTNYFVQSCNVPTVQMGDAVLATPFVNIPTIGDRIAYAEFQLAFKVDEDMKNYEEIFNWMKGIGNYEDDANIIAGSQVKQFFSDASLIITNSTYNAKRRVNFKNTFPTSLSGFNFSSLLNDSEPVLATVSLIFETYEFETL